MYCQNCKQKIAKIKFSESGNGKTNEIFLCNLCAQKLGAFQFGANSNMDDFLGSYVGLSNHQIGGFNIDRNCQGCGGTFEEFQKTGRLGCSQCYQTFADRLEPVIRRIHGNNQYQGKLAGKNVNSNKVENQIDILKKKLREAIKKEEYEVAARLRDEIKSIEGSEKSET